MGGGLAALGVGQWRWPGRTGCVAVGGGLAALAWPHWVWGSGGGLAALGVGQWEVAWPGRTGCVAVGGGLGGGLAALGVWQWEVAWLQGSGRWPGCTGCGAVGGDLAALGRGELDLCFFYLRFPSLLSQPTHSLLNLWLALNVLWWLGLIANGIIAHPVLH